MFKNNLKINNNIKVVIDKKVYECKVAKIDVEIIDHKKYLKGVEVFYGGYLIYIAKIYIINTKDNLYKLKSYIMEYSRLILNDNFILTAAKITKYLYIQYKKSSRYIKLNKNINYKKLTNCKAIKAFFVGYTYNNKAIDFITYTGY
jgi:hypothetical protein